MVLLLVPLVPDAVMVKQGHSNGVESLLSVQGFNQVSDEPCGLFGSPGLPPRVSGHLLP